MVTFSLTNNTFVVGEGRGFRGTTVRNLINKCQCIESWTKKLFLFCLSVTLLIFSALAASLNIKLVQTTGWFIERVSWVSTYNAKYISPNSTTVLNNGAFATARFQSLRVIYYCHSIANFYVWCCGPLLNMTLLCYHKFSFYFNNWVSLICSEVGNGRDIPSVVWETLIEHS